MNASHGRSRLVSTRTRAPRAHAISASGCVLVAVDRAGQVIGSTPQAFKILKAARELGSVEPFRLPHIWNTWLETIDKNAAEPASAPPASIDSPFELDYPGDLSGDEFLLRPGPSARSPSPAEFSQAFDLTQRQGEVLFWLSKGKTNRDIAQILGLSPRTVD